MNPQYLGVAGQDVQRIAVPRKGKSFTEDSSYMATKKKAKKKKKH
jgi:hypothetical protein